MSALPPKADIHCHKSRRALTAKVATRWLSDCGLASSSFWKLVRKNPKLMDRRRLGK